MMTTAFNGLGKVVCNLSTGIELLVELHGDDFAQSFRKTVDSTAKAMAVTISNGIQTNMANSNVEIGKVGFWASIDGITENAFDFCGRLGYDKSSVEYCSGYAITNIPANIIACVSPHYGVVDGILSTSAAIRDLSKGTEGWDLTVANFSNVAFSAGRTGLQNANWLFRLVACDGDVLASWRCAGWSVWAGMYRPSQPLVFVKGPAAHQRIELVKK